VLAAGQDREQFRLIVVVQHRPLQEDAGLAWLVCAHAGIHARAEFARADGRRPGAEEGEVRAFDTGSGRLLTRIPVGQGPTACALPPAGPYSLGHTGVLG
jgi:hypothetical protein